MAATLTVACMVLLVFSVACLADDQVFTTPTGDGIRRKRDVSGRSRRETYETFTFDYDNDERKEFIEKHNEYRASVSPSATAMQRMVWDTDLEIQAQAYASQCRFYHGGQYLVEGSYDSVGQNLWAKSGWNVNNKPAPRLSMSSWWSEVSGYNIESNSCSIDACGHYTQMAWDWEVAVGCGRNYCVDGIEGLMQHVGVRWLVVCHYGPMGNRQDATPYTSGEPCSDCPEGYTGGCQDNLCVEDVPCHGVTCESGGTLDPETCICDCPEGIVGAHCQGLPDANYISQLVQGTPLGEHNGN